MEPNTPDDSAQFLAGKKPTEVSAEALRVKRSELLRSQHEANELRHSQQIEYSEIQRLRDVEQQRQREEQWNSELRKRFTTCVSGLASALESAALRGGDYVEYPLWEICEPLPPEPITERRWVDISGVYSPYYWPLPFFIAIGQLLFYQMDYDKYRASILSQQGVAPIRRVRQTLEAFPKFQAFQRFARKMGYSLTFRLVDAKSNRHATLWNTRSSNWRYAVTMTIGF